MTDDKTTVWTYYRATKDSASERFLVGTGFRVDADGNCERFYSDSEWGDTSYSEETIKAACRQVPTEHEAITGEPEPARCPCSKHANTRIETPVCVPCLLESVDTLTQEVSRLERIIFHQKKANETLARNLELCRGDRARFERERDNAQREVNEATDWLYPIAESIGLYTRNHRLLDVLQRFAGILHERSQAPRNSARIPGISPEAPAAQSLPDRVVALEKIVDKHVRLFTALHGELNTPDPTCT